MAEVNVYKTPNATLEAEGIAGVIDMRTLKPLDTEARTQLKAEYEYNNLGQLNPDSEDTGINATFSYINQFADDSIGIAFAHAAMESPNQENRWNSWGYPWQEYLTIPFLPIHILFSLSPPPYSISLSYVCL